MRDLTIEEFVTVITLQMREWWNLAKKGVGVRLLTLQAKNGRKFIIVAFALRGADLESDGRKILLNGQDIEELLPEIAEKKKEKV